MYPVNPEVAYILPWYLWFIFSKIHIHVTNTFICMQDAVVDFIVKAYNDPAIITSAAFKGKLLVEKQSTVDKKNLLRDYKSSKR